MNANNGQPTDLNTGQGPSASQIDVSGDTNIGNRRTGLTPVHATVAAGFQAYVVNQGDSSVSSFGLLVSNPFVSTVAIEPNSGATYVTASGSLAFVSETALNRVAVIDNNLPAAKTYINVGAAPVASVATPDSRKVYVANTGDGTVTDISTLDLAVLGTPIPVAVVRLQWRSRPRVRFFVVNSTGGAFSVIDTSTDTEVQRFTGLSNPTQVIWDNTLQRVYVVDTGANKINIYNGAAPSLSLLRTVSLPATPIGVAALDNGSKFYVLYAGSPGTVGVYSTQSFQVTSTLTVQNKPVSISAAPGSSKVYVVNQLGDAGAAAPKYPNGSLSIIVTASDTVLTMSTGSAQPVFVTTF